MYYWRKVNIIAFVILILLTIPAIFALLKSGFFVTDDGTWMIVRFTAFFETLKDGQIPARFLERINFGYGYPVSNFLYPGFLYLASVIHILGLGFVSSIKTVMVISLVGSSVFTYLWLRKLFDPYSSFVGALIYLYLPYHLYDVYTRGSVGEVLCLMFVPFIFWQIERKSLSLTSLGIFGLVISHNSLALLFVTPIVLYSLVRKSFIIIVLSGILGGLMSSFFIIPAIFELPLTKFSTTEISNPLKYFADFSLVGTSSIVIIVMSLVFLFIFFGKKLRLAPYIWLFVLFFTVSIFSIFGSTNMSSFVWENLPSSFIQFPFRLLSVLLLCVSFLGGYIIYLIENKGKIKWAGMVLILILISYSAYFYIFPKQTTNYPDDYYATNVDTTTVKGEFMPKWVKESPTTNVTQKIEVIKGNAKVSDIFQKSNYIQFNLKDSKDSIVRVNTIYYPGWEAFMNGDRLSINYKNDKGVMDIPISRPGGTVTLTFGETTLSFLSDLLSVLAFIAVLFLFLRPVLKFR